MKQVNTLQQKMFSLLLSKTQPVTIGKLYTELTNKKLSQLGGKAYKKIKQHFEENKNIECIKNKTMCKYKFIQKDNTIKKDRIKTNTLTLTMIAKKYNMSINTVQGMLYFSASAFLLTLKEIQKQSTMLFDDFQLFKTDIEQNSDIICTELHLNGKFIQQGNNLIYKHEEKNK